MAINPKGLRSEKGPKTKKGNTCRREKKWWREIAFGVTKEVGVIADLTTDDRQNIEGMRSEKGLGV